MAKDAYRETQRYVANLQSIFDFPDEKLHIAQDHDMLDGSDWEYLTANTLHVTDDQFESFHAKVQEKNIWIWLMVVRTWIWRMERTITAER